MRRFAYLILEGRRPVLTSFLFVSTWFLTNMSSCLQRLWKLDVFVPTNTWLRIVVKMLSTCGFACILSMSTASTRCCHVQELIGWHFIYKVVMLIVNCFIIFFGFYWKKGLVFSVRCIWSEFLYICRLQTGMRGAFGKPQGTVARVHIGQPIMSVRAREQHESAIIEALRRAKFKYPGRQKVCHFHFSCWRSWQCMYL